MLPNEPIVIILDEFQYLAVGEDGLRQTQQYRRDPIRSSDRPQRCDAETAQ
ncbi:hypothetical protein [Candidatus Poriferisodalis sp.]|uniref:hypothetical protein n=1 Tax=Candidatus Poriferisodalis sp. TaxID=3101277 RepID=UPI003B027945